MKRPTVIVRQGDRFILDSKRLYPHLRKNEDMVRSALQMACLHYKAYPQHYKHLDPKGQLDKVNDTFYQLLIDWGVYKGK